MLELIIQALIKSLLVWFLGIGIYCMLCWLSDRRKAKKNARKLIEEIEKNRKQQH